MDSLLANYASSDEEEHEDQQPPLPKPILQAKPDKLEDEDFLSKSSSKRGGIFDSLPPPKSSLFGSLPLPKSQSFHNPKPEAEIDQIGEADDERNARISKPKSSSSSSLFSSLPAPNSSSSSSSNSKRVVQFRPPTIINAYSGSVDDEDDDDESEEERQRKKSKGSISTSSAASFLSSIPAPKHSATLGALPSASGRSRRSVLETATPASSASTVNSTKSDEVVNTNEGYLKDQLSDMNYDYSSWSSGSESHSYYSSHGANVGSAPVNNISTGSDAGMFSNAGHLGYQPHEIYDHFTGLGGENYAYHGGYGVASAAVSTAGCDAGMNSDVGSYKAVNYSQENGQNVEYSNYNGSYGDCGSDAQYENNWANVSALPEVSGVVENALPVPGKRGRKDVPPQIVEVKQDELMKNRPREDQVKLTGIAFGPAYQPTSTKGKPSKLHKRKHQIGSLYFDMKQKETELAERRANGYLTKAQTQAKYGW